MATSVNIKLSPQQFDILRESLKRDLEAETLYANDKANDTAARHQARSNAVNVGTLLEFLNKA